MNVVRLVLFLIVMTMRLDQLDIGTRLGKNQIPGNSTRCAATPSQIYPCVKLTVEGVEFTVGYDEKTARVRYLFTQDKHFATKEGLHVGDWTKAREDELLSFSGWKTIGPQTPSGWRIVVGSGYFGEQVQFADGTVIDLTQPHHTPPRTGDVQIRGFEKGGVGWVPPRDR
jgi:hypothetical protein